MRSRREPEEEAPAGGRDGAPDMTPMVDIVFNLIVFFLIVSELSNLSAEALSLPAADMAREPERGPPEATLVVNVLEDGLAKVSGQAYALDPARAGALPPLASRVAVEAAAAEREEDGQSAGVAPSRLRLTIRADKDAPFGHVQRVLDACDDEGVYRTSVAADPEAR